MVDGAQTRSILKGKLNSLLHFIPETPPRSRRNGLSHFVFVRVWVRLCGCVVLWGGVPLRPVFAQAGAGFTCGRNHVFRVVSSVWHVQAQHAVAAGYSGFSALASLPCDPYEELNPSFPLVGAPAVSMCMM